MKKDEDGEEIVSTFGFCKGCGQKVFIGNNGICTQCFVGGKIDENK